MKLQVTVGSYRYTLGAVPKPRYFAFNLYTAEPNILMNSFSNYGTRTPPGISNSSFVIEKKTVKLLNLVKGGTTKYFEPPAVLNMNSTVP